MSTHPGCWYCRKDTLPMLYSKEFDTPVHENCLREAMRDTEAVEAEIMARELLVAEEPDYDEQMDTIHCDESGENTLDVYVQLSMQKGFKQKDDKEPHCDIKFVHTCGMFHIVDVPLSQLRKLASILDQAYASWKGIEVQDYAPKET